MSQKKIILKAENISKQYRLGQVGTGTLSHDLNRWWHQIRGKEDPYLKVGEINDRSTKGKSDYVWALKDINFEVEEGEVLGIIGKNGAGKSTLLKILSKVTSPTTGSIKSRGRIASLLEVGTGFNPELTGRENIYLNGAILGMTKKEIASKLNEIIEFSGCERYIDTPTKRYSSGMTVRLAFAVAAFLEPEILVVDEVLAVGDAEFQKKAIGKMQDISREGGRTVLFVSHNMAAVKSLCTKGILMKSGQVDFIGSVDDTIERYNLTNLSSIQYGFNVTKREGRGEAIIENVIIKDNLLRATNEVVSGDDLIFEIYLDNKSEESLLDVGIGIFDMHDLPQIHCTTEMISQSIVCSNGVNKIMLKIDNFPLISGEFYYNIYVKSSGITEDFIKKAGSFKVEKGDFYKKGNVSTWSKGFYSSYDFSK